MIGIFGANGMLGNYVSNYLEVEGYHVRGFTRADADISKFECYPTIERLVKDCDIVINCAGCIRPVVHQVPYETAFMVNSVFPNFLSELVGGNLIHITTDCVFSGAKGQYVESDFKDAHDIYGLSKQLGEPANSCIVRTSIIGEEIHNSRSLIEWVRSQQGNTVSGYTNHIWNGMTCLQLAKIIECLFTNRHIGTRHFYSDDTTKADLVQMISDTYGFNVEVNPIVYYHSCDRTLRTEYPNVFLTIPDLLTQLQEQKEFRWS